MEDRARLPPRKRPVSSKRWLGAAVLWWIPVAVKKATTGGHPEGQIFDRDGGNDPITGSDKLRARIGLVARFHIAGANEAKQ
jgi:hypothetical protein